MHFAKLQKVIQYLQMFIPCPHCRTKFAGTEIQVLATIVDSGLLALHCKKCHFSAVAHFALTFGNKKKEEFIDVRIEKSGIVDVNDIIDMHNLLKDFKGDIKEMLL